MPGEIQNGMGHSQFEALLSDAIDGRLTGSQKDAFDAHGRTCPACGPLLADVIAGMKLLNSLEELDPPKHMVHNILLATSGISSARLNAELSGEKKSFGERARGWWDSFLTPTAAFVRQPRFVMSFGMIFFSFSLALSAAGVKAADVAKIDLHPAAIKRAYYTAEGRVVKFYENIRFVYEIETRVRDFKKATTPAETAPAKPSNEKNNDNNKERKPKDTSGK